MFDDNIHDEIYHSMQNKLVSNQLENKYAFNKVAKAADYLNNAAKLFDKAGMHKEAAEITNIIKDIYNKLK